MAEIGPAANFIALIGAGTKLSLVIFDLASRIGSAGTALESLGKEISLFCAVTKQLQEVLSNANFNYSPTAIETAQDIIERCRKLLDRIGDVVTGLLRMEGPEGIPSMAFVSKVRWTFKKPKIELMRSTLESSKLTLQIMLTTMTFAQTLSQRSTSSIQTEAEDKQDQIITRGLILSQQREIERLIRLEDEQEHDVIPENTRPARSYASLSEPMHKDSSGKMTNRVSRLLKGLNPISTSTSSFDLTQITSPQYQQQQQQQQLDMPKTKALSQPVPHSNEWRPQKPPARVERASAWLKVIIDANYQDPFDPHPGQPQKRLSSVETAGLPLLLLRKWTDQADHLEELNRSSNTHGQDMGAEGDFDTSEMWNEHPKFNFKFPSPEEVKKSQITEDGRESEVDDSDDDDEATDPNTILSPLHNLPEKRFNSNTKRSISFDKALRAPTDPLSPTATIRQSIVAAQMQRIPATPLSPPAELTTTITQEEDQYKTTTQALSSEAMMFFNTAPSAFTTGKHSISLSPEPLPKVAHTIAISEGGLSNDTAPTTSDSDDDDDDEVDEEETDTATDASSTIDNKPSGDVSKRGASSSFSAASVTRPLPFPYEAAISTSPYELVDDIDNDMIDSTPSHEVLNHLLRMHDLEPPSSTLRYELKVVYGGQQRTFSAHDRPLQLVRQFDEVGLRPVLLLERV